MHSRPRFRIPKVNVAFALGLLAFVALGPFMAELTANSASRVALTASLAEHGSVDITSYRYLLGVDYSVVGDELRSDKAPGQAIAAVVPYVIGKSLGFVGVEHREQAQWAAWWLALWTSILPLCVLLGLVCRWLTTHDERRAPRATLYLAVGTLLVVFAVPLYGHSLAALLGFGAWL